MGKPRIIAGIDVGSTKICALVAEALPGGLNLVAASAVAASGIQRGAVVDLDRATAAIGRSLAQVAAESGVKIGGVLLAIGTEVVSLNSRGSSLGQNGETVFTSADVDKAIEAAVEGLPATRQVVHAIPRGFRVDGRANVANPTGLRGRRIDAEVHVVTSEASAVLSLVDCVERCGTSVEDIVAKPLAAAEAVLDREERELGVVVADIGGGTCGLTVFVEGTPWHTTSVPFGGKHLTQDVAAVLGIAYDLAEELKLAAGHADPTAIDPNQECEIPAIDGGAATRISRRYICEILEARVAEILEMIRSELDRSGYAGLLPAGLVLTGGTAQLPGISRVASQVLRMRVRVGQSEIGAGCGLGGPAYSGAIGLLLSLENPSLRHSARRAALAATIGKTERSSPARRWLRNAWLPLAGPGGSTNRS